VSSYLMQHYDPGIPVGEETNKELEKEEQERLHHLWSVASVSAVIPRRLGGDASREELASDKKISKRVGWAAVQSYRAWGGTRKTANRDAEVEKEGAQVRWEKWWPEHEAWLIQRRQYYATRGLKRDPLWAKSARRRTPRRSPTTHDLDASAPRSLRAAGTPHSASAALISSGLPIPTFNSS